MTTNYHSPLIAADLLTLLPSLNEVFSDLDSGITGLLQTLGGQITAEAGEGLGDRDTAYLNPADGKIYLMDADATTPKAGHIRGFVSGTFSTGQTATLVITGIMNGFSGLTAKQPVYVNTTGGDLTQTRPVPALGGSQVAIIEMGIAMATDTIFIDPQPIVYEKRNAMALNATLTINHHADERGYVRTPKAYITELSAGTALEEYTSGNQDVDVKLRNRTVATYTADQCTGGTPSTSASEGSFPISNLFDNNTSTQSGKQAVSFPWWVEYNFGANKTIRRYTIRGHNSVPATDPKDWTLEYHNGSTWVAIDTRTNETGWSNGQTRTYDVATAATSQRWRINITANNTHADLWMTEIEMMEAATFTDGPDKLAQTISIGVGETIATIDLYLKKVGSPTGTATVRLETVDGSNNPTGTLAHANATTTFAESSLGTSYATKTVTFTDFTPGAATYAIVLSTSRAVDESNYIAWGADASSPGYAGGEMKSQASGTWSNQSKDAIFAVRAPGVQHPSNIDADWWSSTHADMVNRYGDGAGADLNIKTTFKCLRSAGFDDVSVQVVLP